MSDTDVNTNSLPTGDAIIEIMEMHKWFGEFHVLQDINLTVQKKERNQLVISPIH